tara:strand:+ start:1695 stop:1847 length:153 start_codon:yes stop_codon:yes gene_type:complete
MKHRYFRATQKANGEPDEESIIEIPSPFFTRGMDFSIGILIGIIISLIVR